MDPSSSVFFPQPLTPLELTVCTVLTDLFLDTDVSLFYESNARYLARLPIDLNQISALLWFDVYPIFVWNIFAWEWMGVPEEFVKEEIENRRWSLLSRLNRFWTWPLVFVWFWWFPYHAWKELERRIVRERKKRQYVVNWGRSVGWSVVDWRAHGLWRCRLWLKNEEKSVDDGRAVD